MAHSWDLDYKQARQLQQRLALKVIDKDCFGLVQTVAGIDVKCLPGSRVRGAVLIFSWPRLQLIEARTVVIKTSFPYIPGLLSFREGPVCLQCFELLDHRPDLLFFDGNGLMHPRGLGLASHLGLLLDLPAIGVAKTKLLGQYNMPGQQKGSYSQVEYRGKVVGAAVRTREKVKPVFVSAGHNISLNTAIKFTLAASKYRICEPTRQAHNWLAKYAEPEKW